VKSLAGERPNKTKRRMFTTLATRLYEIAGDMAALGPGYNEGVTKRTGKRVYEHLSVALSELNNLRDALACLREEHIQDQMERQRLTDATDLKLHLGCGQHTIDGWINIDIFPAQFSLNLRRGLPFKNGTAKYVFASHLLEHLFYPDEALHVLEECKRVLSSNGVLRVAVPDIRKYAAAYARNDLKFFEARYATWKWWPKDRTMLEQLLRYSGVTSGPWSFLMDHKFGYDYSTIHKLLTASGFGHVYESYYQRSSYADLRLDNYSSVAGARYNNEHYSLFVEATPEPPSQGSNLSPCADPC
jgi:predicted SAM-dependent methyltransferase